MYLSKLSNEQKNLFLSLCINASNADGNFDCKEKAMIKQYSEEMRVEPFYSTDVSTDTILKKLVEISNQWELNAIAIEIAALVVSDRKYDSAENELMNKIGASFGLSTEMIQDIIEQVENIYTIYDRLDKYI